jgi:hypothetical protein
MAANRHADAVRCYLDYLCESPKPSEASPWVDWAKLTKGATAVAGFTLSVGACGGEAFDVEGGQAGNAAGGVIGYGGTAYGVPLGGRGAVSTGGVRAGGTGGIGALYGLPMGGVVGTGGAVAYGVPMGGYGVGGRATAGSGAVPTGGVVSTGGTAYGISGGYRATGGSGAVSTGGVFGTGGTLYGLPGGGRLTGGTGATATGGVRTGGTAGVGTLYGIPIGGTGGVDCGCTNGAYTPVCGTDGATHDAACSAECVPVDIACVGECPCDPSGASCDVGCTAVTSSSYCDTARVEWVCSGSHRATLLSGVGCEMLPTGSIRYCCPGGFLSACQ